MLKEVVEEMSQLNLKAEKLKKELTLYKTNKHGLQTENEHLKQAIILNDQELLKSLRENFKNEKK